MSREEKDVVLLVEGMHCTACRRRVENALSAVPGVVRARADHARGTAEVRLAPGKADLPALREAVRKAGYTPRGEKKRSPEELRREKNRRILLNAAGILFLVAALFFVARWTGAAGFTPEIDPAAGYGALFLTGLVTSVHCVAMCGGINLSQNLSRTENAAPRVKNRLLPGLLYNAGRVSSYTLIGGIAGAAGAALPVSDGFRGAVSLFAGLFMLAMGLKLLGVLPSFPRLPIPAALRGSHLFRWRGKLAGRGPFFVGLLNGLMPCGPLQAMQLYALGTGSFLAGALSMLTFSLGTIPLMFAFGAAGALLSRSFTRRMMQAGAVLVIVLGFVTMNRGLALAGFTGGVSSSDGSVAVEENGVQVVRSTFRSGGYDPITVEAGVPVRWIITVGEKDLNGCNNPFVIPAYGLRIELSAGENVVEFTPQESGRVGYSCWMGMIRSSINVVEDLPG